MSTFYGPAVAYTHDRAFTEGQKTLGPELLKLFQIHGFPSGLVVDLGSGSGQWLAQAASAGYDVVGIDQSDALMGFARERLPNAELRVGSIYEADLPHGRNLSPYPLASATHSLPEEKVHKDCVAITALGEVLNYVADETAVQPLGSLFHRVHAALKPGGLFVFDLIDPFPDGLAPERNWHEGEGFAIMFEKSVSGPVLKREIVCFRRAGDTYERNNETHYQRLFCEQEIRIMLEKAGFDVETMTSIGAHVLLPHRRMYVAVKPSK